MLYILYKGGEIMKNIQNKLMIILDKCKICGRLWDENGNCVKEPKFNYQTNEFICKDCDPLSEWR
jgi:hypothetical protein